MRGAAPLAAVRKQVETLLPEAQVIDYREGNPALTEGLDRATNHQVFSILRQGRRYPDLAFKTPAEQISPGGFGDRLVRCRDP